MIKSTDQSVAYQRNRYPKLLFIHTPSIPYSLVSFWLRAGSRFEAEKKAGLAHLFEHIFMKKTKLFPDVSKRLQYIEERGILFGAFTSQDPVYYYTLQEPKLTLEGYEVLHDGFQNSIFERADIESAKEPVIDELKKAERTPFNVIWNLANRGLWPNSSLTHEPLGSEKTIQTIKKDDIYNFRQKYYRNTNLTILVLSPDKRIFTNLMNKIELPIEIEKDGLHTFEEKFHKPTNRILKNKIDNFIQIAISFRTNGNKTEEEVAAIRLVKNYLAGGWISRLNTRLRIEKNITYHVDGYIRDFPDTGMLRFVFSTKKQNLPSALHIFKEEIETLKNQNISEIELKKHKNSSKIGIITNSLNSQSLLWHYGWASLVYGHTPTPLGEFLKNIDKLNPENIKRVAKKHLNNISVAGIGDINEDDLRL